MRSVEAVNQTSMKYLTHPATLIFVGMVLGAAYGKRTPIVSTVASKLPNSAVL